ncbi:MAG TPA: YdeI/OmpD-associated family protein [Anaerolineales bacterium]|nr:YdeI/OmpD-associated family protein [Anaerolineales bacterium]
MDITRTLYASTRAEWRKWLKKNYKTEKEIWLVFYKKSSGKPRVEYNDAVEEALCFGWIDSLVKKMDDECFAQRFSPRNPRTAYSQANKERLKKLIAEGKVMKDVRASIQDISQGGFETPNDILRAIKANEEAWRNFQNFSETYKRIRIAFIDGARSRPKEFQKRLNYFIKMTEKNKRFWFGGIEKYY